MASNRKYSKWMSIADNHGDKQDDGAVSVAKQFMKEWKPIHRIHQGDCFDVRCLRKGASEPEQQEAILADIETGLELLSWYKPTVFLRGNHDERLWDGLKNPNGFVREFCAMIIEKILKVLGPECQVIPYCKRVGVYRLGHLKFIHGFGNGGLYAAKNHAQVYGNVLLGHVHAVDRYTIPALEQREGRVIGCLCQLDQDYNRAHLNTLRQSHGFAYGFLYDDGNFEAFQAKGVDSKWLIPTAFTELSPKGVKHG